MNTKGKAKVVIKPFTPPYIHIGSTKIAIMAATGCLSDAEQIEHAQRLVTCWNEHDTLKAKADLLEYTLDWAEALKTLLIQISDTELPHTAETIKRIDELLSKAKELKC